MKPPQGRRGFGLLEAIVAVALLGSAGLMVFAWIQSSLETVSRNAAAEQRARLQLEGAAYLGSLNPARQPEGVAELGTLRLRWTSRRLEPLRPEFDYGGEGRVRWRVGLFELEVQAEQDGVQVQWQQRVAGWTDAAAPSPGEAP